MSTPAAALQDPFVAGRRGRGRELVVDGIVGMRERAALVGGRLDAGGRDGAFRVEADLPVAPEAP